MNNKKWWDSLTSKQKWENYKLLCEVNNHHATTLHKIVTRLLGDDYYTLSSDWFNSTNEIYDDICYKYKDVNYSFSRMLKTIKKNIKDYFKNNI